jgi:hypothetical protein
MPVLRVDDERLRRERIADLAIDDRNDLLATRHRQAALRIGEVVLDVDHDECRLAVVSLHDLTLPARRRHRPAAAR